MRTGDSNVKAAPDASPRVTRRSLALLLLVVAGITLPFIFEAFHLDDTIFIWLGREKLHDPFALGLPGHGYEGNFFSLYLDTHPPLLTSYLSLLMRITGGASEAAMHLGFIIFPALAAVSMYFLSRRFTGSPLTAALLLVVTPGFMVMTQSVMTDVPALSLWLAAIAAYVFAVDREEPASPDLDTDAGGPGAAESDGRWRSGPLFILAGVFISLAVLTTYQSLSLAPLLFVYALLRKKVTVRSMLPLAAGLAVFAAIVIYYLAATGNPPKLSYSFGVNLTPSFIANKILSIVSVIGGATVFPVLLAAGLLKGKREFIAFAAVFVLMLIFFVTRIAAGIYTPAAGILQAVFYSAGLLAVYRFFSTGIDAVASSQRTGSERDDIFLILWISGVLAYSLVLLPYASTRYLLPLFPPVVLMFVRYARGAVARRRWQLFAAAAVIGTALTGMAVSIADYQLAGVYRSFAADQAEVLQRDGRQLWFAGEFGLRYYLEEGGGRYLTRDDDSPRPGDHVVLSNNLIAFFIADSLRDRLVLERSVEHASAWPFRIEGAGSQAGFYDQFHGNLPWSISSQPIEKIDIYSVK